jgi:hypothetical protein
MSNKHEGAAALRISRDAATFASLPLPLAQRIFLALPADARGRASCVCRAWRDALAEPALWTRLDMSLVRAFTYAERERFNIVLRGAAGRARGQLQQVELSQRDYNVFELWGVLYSNTGSMRELHLHAVLSSDVFVRGEFVPPSVDMVVASAPLLQVLTAEDVTCPWEDAPRVLRAEPPFALLRLRRSLRVRFADALDRVGGMQWFGPFAAALADAALQPALSHVCIEYADTADLALMGALADAVVARRLRELKLEFCTPPAAALLARLLTEGSLDVLELGPWHWSAANTLFDAAGAALVADALRANATLTTLELDGAYLSRDMGVVGALLGALVGHVSLRELRIDDGHTPAENRSAFGAALAALIAADAPALQVVVCYCSRLGDDGVAPIVEALPLNRHLRTLDVRGNQMSEAFAHERLLPAVRANTSLRWLTCANHHMAPPAAAEAEELVRRRAGHDW